MIPTSKQLIDGIRWGLDNRVRPEVSSDWALSTLRSVDALLAHLSARADQEGTILWEDNADARAVLGEVEAALASLPGAGSLAREVAEIRTRQWRPPGEFPSLDSLREENHALVGAIDRVVAALSQEHEPAAERDRARAALRAFVRRQMGRRVSLFVPAFTGPLF